MEQWYSTIIGRYQYQIQLLVGRLRFLNKGHKSSGRFHLQRAQDNVQVTKGSPRPRELVVAFHPSLRSRSRTACIPTYHGGNTRLLIVAAIPQRHGPSFSFSPLNSNCELNSNSVGGSPLFAADFLLEYE